MRKSCCEKNQAKIEFFIIRKWNLEKNSIIIIIHLMMKTINQTYENLKKISFKIYSRKKNSHSAHHHYGSRNSFFPLKKFKQNKQTARIHTHIEFLLIIDAFQFPLCLINRYIDDDNKKNYEFRFCVIIILNFCIFFS